MPILRRNANNLKPPLIGHPPDRLAYQHRCADHLTTLPLPVTEIVLADVAARPFDHGSFPTICYCLQIHVRRWSVKVFVSFQQFAEALKTTLYLGVSSAWEIFFGKGCMA